MFEVNENFRHARNENDTCPMCSQKKEITEHLCECDSYGNSLTPPVDLVGNNNKESLRRYIYCCHD